MKNAIQVVLVLIVFMATSISTAQNVVPPFKGDDYVITFCGTSRTTFSINELPNARHIDSDLLRLRLNVQMPNPKLSAFVEIEATDVGTSNSNWLRMGYLNYQVNEAWIVRAGRLFLAAPYYTTPPYFLLETVHFPQEPWGYYAYGIQTEGTFGNGWSLIADISGNSTSSFDEGKSFDRFETSGRLEKEFSKGVSAGLVYQISPSFMRGGLDFHLSRGPVNLSGEVYAAHEHGVDVCGGNIFGSYKLTECVLPHLELDIHHTNPGINNVIVTPGIMFRTKHDNVRLIVDCEWHVNESKASGIYSVLQFRF